MFVSTDNYPFFREDACHSHNKTNRFKLENFNQQVCKSQESLPIFPLPKERKKILKKKFNTDKKVDKKEKLQTSVNFLDSINESKSILPKTQYLSKLNNENLSTLIHYKKLESVKKTNPIFHLPPLVTKPIDPETTFLTFGELDEINEKLLLHQQIKGSSIDKIYEKNKLNMELTYNKTQYGKLKTIYNNEEKSSYKILIENISKNKLKELRTPKIKTYSSLALLSNGNNNSNFFTEVQLPEPEKEQLERKKEIKIKKGINSYDNIHFESSIYFYSYEQNGWRPEIRELCTMILLDKKIYIYSGIGRNIMDDIVVADLGF